MGPPLERPWIAPGTGGVVYVYAYTNYTPRGRVPRGPRMLLWRSADRGQTFTPLGPIAPNGAAARGCSSAPRPVVDPRDPDTIYVAYRSSTIDRCDPQSRSSLIALAVSRDGGRTWVERLVKSGDADVVDFTISLDVDRMGHVFLSWGEHVAAGGTRVMFRASPDRGRTWNRTVRVNSLPGYRSNMLGAVQALPDGNRADLAWYTSPTTSFESPRARWTVAFARSFDPLATRPHFAQSRVSKRVVHVGQLCGGACAKLGDFLGLDIGRDGRARVAWWNHVYGEDLVYVGVEKPPRPGSRT